MGTCFTPVIFDDNEGLYAGAVREMHESGNWLVPTSNGFPRVQKPPLVYWTMLVSTSLFGKNEFALRLPNALATAGWIVATYLIMRRLGGERFGVASAVVLASMLGVWVFTHLVQPEPFLACFISLSLWCLVEARLFARPDIARFGRFPGDYWYLLFWTFLALGSLSKGLHGALWPLGTVVLAALFVPSWRPWLRPVLSLRGFALFSCSWSPWYAYMACALPGFLAAHFVNEQLGASLNTRYPADAKQLPLVQFYAQHLLFWMPWTLLLPGSIYARGEGDARWRAQAPARFSRRRRSTSIKLLALLVPADPGFGRFFHPAGLLQHDLLGRGRRVPRLAMDEPRAFALAPAPALSICPLFAGGARRNRFARLRPLDPPAAWFARRHHCRADSATATRSWTRSPGSPRPCGDSLSRCSRFLESPCWLPGRWRAR